MPSWLGFLRSIYSKRCSLHMHTIIHMGIMRMKIHTNTTIMSLSSHGLPYVFTRSSMDSAFGLASDFLRQSDIVYSFELPFIRSPSRFHLLRYFAKVNSRKKYRYFSYLFFPLQQQLDTYSQISYSRIKIQVLLD